MHCPFSFLAFCVVISAFLISHFQLQLCSCAFLGAGLWLRLSYEGYATLLPQHAGLSADTIFMGIGGTGFVVSFFGCCGAWVQSRCLLVLVSE